MPAESYVKTRISRVWAASMFSFLIPLLGGEKESGIVSGMGYL
jgi:hypothetical protein